MKPINDGEAAIARQTDAGREMLRVLDQVRRRMTGEERIAKAFELTEITRESMRSGLRRQFPDLDEGQIHRLYIDRLLSYHGLSLDKIEQMRHDEDAQTRRND